MPCPNNQVLGLAKLYAPGGVYHGEGDDDATAMLLPNVHFQLAKAYEASGCTEQAYDHCNAVIQSMPADVASSPAAGDWQKHSAACARQLKEVRWVPGD